MYLQTDKNFLQCNAANENRKLPKLPNQQLPTGDLKPKLKDQKQPIGGQVPEIRTVGKLGDLGDKPILPPLDRK